MSCARRSGGNRLLAYPKTFEPYLQGLSKPCRSYQRLARSKACGRLQSDGARHLECDRSVRQEERFFLVPALSAIREPRCCRPALIEAKHARWRTYPRYRLLRETWLSSAAADLEDRKSTRLNSSHQITSYAVFC